MAPFSYPPFYTAVSSGALPPTVLPEQYAALYEPFGAAGAAGVIRVPAQRPPWVPLGPPFGWLGSAAASALNPLHRTAALASQLVRDRFGGEWRHYGVAVGSGVVRM